MGDTECDLSGGGNTRFKKVSKIGYRLAVLCITGVLVSAAINYPPMKLYSLYLLTLTYHQHYHWSASLKIN